MNAMQYEFPDGFIWGAATAALQIGGATTEDGRSPSRWDVYRQEHPERFWEGASPDIACDHYHRYLEDVALISAMGHNGYRMSIAWPRITSRWTMHARCSATTNEATEGRSARSSTF